VIQVVAPIYCPWVITNESCLSRLSSCYGSVFCGIMIDQYLLCYWLCQQTHFIMGIYLILLSPCVKLAYVRYTCILAMSELTPYTTPPFTSYICTSTILGIHPTSTRQMYPSNHIYLHDDNISSIGKSLLRLVLIMS
jgi:hypothetical protein